MSGETKWLTPRNLSESKRGAQQWRPLGRNRPKSLISYLKPYDLSEGRAKRRESGVEARKNNDVQILVDDLRIGAKGKSSRGIAGSS